MSWRLSPGENSPGGAAKVKPSLGAAPAPVHNIDGDVPTLVLELSAGATAKTSSPVISPNSREQPGGRAGERLLEAAGSGLAVDPVLLEHGRLTGLGPGLRQRTLGPERPTHEVRP